MLRVQAANTLYEATARLARFCIESGILVSIENPSTPFFGQCPAYGRCSGAARAARSSSTTACRGERDEAAQWWCSQHTMDSLGDRCSKDHASWRPFADAGGRLRFAAAGEAAYPAVLCQRVACLLASVPQWAARLEAPDLLRQVRGRQTMAINSILMGILPRGQKARPLVSEFGCYNACAVSPSGNEALIHALLARRSKGAQIQRRKLCKWGQIRVCLRLQGVRFALVI